MPERISTFRTVVPRLAMGAAIATAGVLCTVQVAGAYPAPPGETSTVSTASPAVAPGGRFPVTAHFILANGQPNTTPQVVTFVMTCVPGQTTSAPQTATTDSSGAATATFTAPSQNSVCTIIATAADGTQSQTTVRVNPSANAPGQVPGGPGNTGGGGAPSGGLPGLPIAADAGIGALILLAGATVVLRRRHSATS